MKKKFFIFNKKKIKIKIKNNKKKKLSEHNLKYHAQKRELHSFSSLSYIGGWVKLTPPS